MGSKKTHTYGTQTNTPWAEASPYYPDLYKQGQEAMQSNQNNVYTGDFVAQPNNAMRQGAGLLEGVAGALPNYSGDVTRNLSDVLSGKYLNLETNPYLMPALQASMKPVTDQFMQQVLPGINDAAISAGAYGGARQDLAQNIAVDTFGRTQNDAVTKVAYDNYLRELERMLNPAATVDSAVGALNAPGKQLLAAGGIQQGFDQAMIDNNMKKFQYSQTAPWQGLTEFSNLLTAGGFGTKTVDMTTQERESNATQIAKGIIGGASMLASAFNPVGPGGMSSMDKFMSWIK